MDSRSTFHMSAPDSTGCDSLPMLESSQTWIVKELSGCMARHLPHPVFPLYGSIIPYPPDLSTWCELSLLGDRKKARADGGKLLGRPEEPHV